MHTHYDNLKVARNAPHAVIKAAYRALSQQYHPDKNSRPDATRIMKILNEAYAVLGDPEARRRYDETIAEEVASPDVETPAAAQETPTPDREQENPPPFSADPSQAPRSTSNYPPLGIFLPVGCVLVGAIILLVGFLAHTDSSQSASASFANSSQDASTPGPERISTSFDCNKAHTRSEKLICHDADLAALDRDLATVFAQAKAAAPDQHAFAEAARQNWNWRNKNCMDKACLVTWYDDQRSRLVGILNSPPQASVSNQSTSVGIALSTQTQGDDPCAKPVRGDAMSYIRYADCERDAGRAVAQQPEAQSQQPIGHLVQMECDSHGTPISPPFDPSTTTPCLVYKKD